MFEPVFQDPFLTKGAEYLLVIAFLALLAVFWRALIAGPGPAHAVPARVQPAEWFVLPEDRMYHVGNSWAMPDAGGSVTVGLSDFAARLVGPLERISLPSVGAAVGQGEKAWSLVADDGRSVDMLSPVDGTIVDVNAALAANVGLVEHDPYGEGWLLKVRPRRLHANRQTLMSGARARRWMDEVVTGLRGRMATNLGVLSQDGGVPLHGMARAIDPEHWDELAATILLTDEEVRHV